MNYFILPIVIFYFSCYAIHLRFSYSLLIFFLFIDIFICIIVVVYLITQIFDSFSLLLFLVLFNIMIFAIDILVLDRDICCFIVSFINIVEFIFLNTEYWIYSDLFKILIELFIT